MNIEPSYKKLISGLQQSMRDDSRKYYVGAVCLDRKGKILSFGYNSYCKTHPSQKHYAEKSMGKAESCYLHAEIASLVKARGTVHSVLVIRITSTGDISMAKPCRICDLAMREAGVKQVWYTDSEGILCSYMMGRIN